jgi:hypothetical protein
MSQDSNSYAIPNTGTLSGLSLVNDINQSLQALDTQNAGTTQPPGTLYAYSRWFDTTNKVVKRRNAANSAWVLDGTGAEAFHVTKSASYSFALSDHETSINITGSAGYTFTIPASTNLMDGWSVALQNNTGVNQTIAPTGTDTINGVNASITLLPGRGCLLVNNGVSNTLAMFFGSQSPLPPGTPLMWPLPAAPSWALVRDGSAISRATYANLFAALCPARNGTTTNAANTVTGLSITADLYIGMPIEGTGIPAGTTIASITSSTAITMSANATASGTVPVTLFYYGYGSGGSSSTFGVPDDRGAFERGLDTGAAGRDTLTYACTNTSGQALVTGLSSTLGMSVGMALSGTGVAGGATIAQINSATSITMSANSTSAVSSITVTGNRIGNYSADQLASHQHSTSYQVYNNSGNSSLGAGASSITMSVITVTPTGNTETRPKNRAYLPIIVY